MTDLRFLDPEGLTNRAAFNERFGLLNGLYQYWWRRIPDVIVETDESQRNIVTTIYSDSIYHVCISYSDSVSISNTGALELVNPSESNFSYHTDFDVSVLNGKYFRLTLISGSGTTSDINTGNVYKGKSNIVKTTSGSQSYSCLITCSVCASGKGEPEFIQSSDRNAYPDSGTEDGYEYEYLGTPFDNAREAPKVATGSYVGTGTYGSGNPNSLTFKFTPKLLFVAGVFGRPNTTGNGTMTIITATETEAYSNVQYREDSATSVTYRFEGNTVTWWSTQGSFSSTSQNGAQQGNKAGVTYYYLALG